LAPPDCFLAAHDAATGDAVLVLEDLSALPGGDDVEGCPPQQVRQLVRRLAEFHAQHWSSRRRDLPWIPTFKELQPDAEFARIWRLMYFRHRRVMPPEFAQIGERLCELLPAFRARLVRPPLTLVHGDLRTDNVMFGEHGPRVLDWQVVSWARGPLDLGYFCTQSLAPGLRRDIEAEVVAFYHATLVERGVRGYSLDDCRQDFRLGGLQNAVTFVLAGAALDFSGQRARRLLTVTLERIAAFVADHQPFELLAPQR
jgi:hypothetical protein